LQFDRTWHGSGRLHRFLFSLTLAGALLAARPAGAFSVVAHLEAIDASWDRQLARCSSIGSGTSRRRS
jgi:hypothetical protein